MNIAESVTRASTAFPHRIAVLDGDTSWSYSDLDRTSSELAAVLGHRGVKRGDRVALLLPNCAAFVVSYLAIVRIGAIAVSVSTRLTEAEVRLVLEDATPKALLATEALLDRVSGDLRRRMTTITLRGKPQITDLPPLPHGDRRTTPLPLPPAAPAALLYSSGTTGHPKGVLLSHSNVMLNARAKARYIGASPIDRLLLFLPLFHCYGQNAVMNTCLSAGATLVILSGFEPRAAQRAVAEHRATMFFGVPTTYRVLLDADPDLTLLATIRYFMSAGAPLPVETNREWYVRCGQHIRVAYGLTETSPFASYNDMESNKPGSIGAPIEGVEMAVLAPDLSTVGVGSIGEIAVRGPNVMLGYWNDEAATREVIINGWVHTGDLGWCDEDGDYFVVDRLKDVIIVSGQNVYPAEVERVLEMHPAIEDVAVFGRPHRVVGEVVCANVVVRPGSQPSMLELRSLCASRLAPFKIPTRFNFVGGIPKTPTGKALKRELRSQAVGLERTT